MNGIIIEPKLIKSKTHFSLLFLIFILLSFAFSCKNDPLIPKPQAKLALTVEDVSCTEAWLNLKLENVTLPVNLELRSDTSILKTYTSINSNDTVLYVDSLLPNQSYNFQISGIGNPASGIKSDVIPATTMDTTSHNFSWQTFEFGQHSSSVLYDVAIIDENNIWAVGEIFMNDSLGNPEPQRYNGVVWDGNTWSVIRIPYNFNGTNFYHPIQSVYIFNPSDIWFCGNGVIHWDGNSFVPISIPTSVWGPYQMNKIWGSSSSDLYVAGNNGNIAHYNGSQWRLVNIPNDIGMETLNVRDIWGVKNEENETELLITAAKFPLTRKFVVGKIINNTVVPIFIGNLADANPKHGLWFSNGRKYYLTGSSIHSKNDIESAEEWKLEVPSLYFQECIRGTSYNNIFSAGNFGDIFHFNGQSWKSLKMYSGVNNGVFTSISSTPTITAFCGVSNNKAVITIIK